MVRLLISNAPYKIRDRTTEIIDDFPELTETDIRACLEFAADREHRLVASVSAA
ncbi:MAG: DUF433 domain-containing protein [Symploca sp. SIO3E6]|nr:DUF433 domain-containing protein [Caldora sp. SIO3E6]